MTTTNEHNLERINSGIFENNTQPSISNKPISPTEQVGTSPSLNQYLTDISYPSVEPNTTNDSSLNELANPQYAHNWNAYNNPYFLRAFVSKCLATADSAGEFLRKILELVMRCDNSIQWADSMRDEMKSIIETRTWKLTSIPNEAKRIFRRN